MIALDRRHLLLLRLQSALLALVVCAAAIILDIWLARRGWTRSWLLSAVAVPVALLAAWLLPVRRYRAWGYRQDNDELHVKHGQFVRQLTIVPFGRVQHIDIAQGPMQRALGLATLVLNTAGTRGAAVRLPGLDPQTAEAMRDHIRGKIRQDLW